MILLERPSLSEKGRASNKREEAVTCQKGLCSSLPFTTSTTLISSTPHLLCCQLWPPGSPLLSYGHIDNLLHHPYWPLWLPSPPPPPPHTLREDGHCCDDEQPPAGHDHSWLWVVLSMTTLVRPPVLVREWGWRLASPFIHKIFARRRRRRRFINKIFTSSSFFSPSMNLPPLQSLNSEPEYSFQMRCEVFLAPKPGIVWYGWDLSMSPLPAAV